MTSQALPSPEDLDRIRWIDRPEALEALARRIRRVGVLALDTEANSFHAYRERLCLVQVGLPEGEYLIDPFQVSLEPLRPVLEDPAVQTVLHGADYDVRLLKREAGIGLRGIFDTMWAARWAGRRRFGLGALLEEIFEIRLEKKFQRFNWGRRPLPQEARRYAALDVRYLLPLRDRLLEEIRARGAWRLTPLEETFRALEDVEPAPPRDPVEGFWRIKGAHRLPPRGRAVLAALYRWREGEAARRDVPPFYVVGDRTLLALAADPPRTPADLSRREGLPERLRRRYGRAILAAVREGLRASPPPLPEGGPAGPVPDRQVRERIRRLKAWRRRTAEEEGLDPDLVLPPKLLKELALAPPPTLRALRERLAPWQWARYGEGLWRILGEG